MPVPEGRCRCQRAHSRRPALRLPRCPAAPSRGQHPGLPAGASNPAAIRFAPPFVGNARGWEPGQLGASGPGQGSGWALPWPCRGQGAVGAARAVLLPGPGRARSARGGRTQTCWAWAAFPWSHLGCFLTRKPTWICCLWVTDS